jgi:cell division protein FtsB
MEETVGHLRTRNNSLFARTVLGITGLICAAFLLGTLTQAWSNSVLTQKVQTAEQSLQKARSENQKLKRQMQYYRDPAVIESEARQQLRYVRPGEHSVVVTNKGHQEQTQTPPNKHVVQPENYWQDWWKVFFA